MTTVPPLVTRTTRGLARVTGKRINPRSWSRTREIFGHNIPNDLYEPASVRVLRTRSQPRGLPVGTTARLAHLSTWASALWPGNRVSRWHPGTLKQFLLRYAARRMNGPDQSPSDRLGGSCRGSIPRVPKATGHGPTTSKMLPRKPRATARLKVILGAAASSGS